MFTEQDPPWHSSPHAVLCRAGVLLTVLTAACLSVLVAPAGAQEIPPQPQPPPPSHTATVIFEEGFEARSDGEVAGFGWSNDKPLAIRLERKGATIGSAGPGQEPTIKADPEPGDVVRLFMDGVDQGTVTWSGRPTLDDPCGQLGKASVAGTRDAGSTVTLHADDGDNQVTANVIYGAEERFTATFSRAIRPYDRFTVHNGYETRLASGHTALVGARRVQPVCPPSASPVFAGPTRHPAVRVRPGGTFDLQNRVSCPGRGFDCRLQIVVLRVVPAPSPLGTDPRVIVPAHGSRMVRGRLSPQAMRLLKRRRALKVQVRIDIHREAAAVDYFRRSVRLELRAPPRTAVLTQHSAASGLLMGLLTDESPA